MKRLIVIVGHTATGKTGLALELARKFDGELVSADSRQVYKYMDVVTGKDVPDDAVWHRREFSIFPAKQDLASSDNFQFTTGYWKTKDGIRIYGYDVVRPDQEFSVKQYRDIANNIIRDIITRGKLPILVGGTGLYIKSVIDPMQNIDVPRNEILREKYSDKTATELYQIFTKRNPARAIYLNASDRKNPRRLIRQIEIDEYEKVNNVDVANNLNQDRIEFDEIFHIGLKITDTKKRNQVIDARVKARLGNEMDEEIDFLIKKDFINYTPKHTIGYAQWMQYLRGRVSKKEAIEKWKIAERQYARRQMTWFKKQKGIDWYDVSKKDWKKRLENRVKKWYTIE
jgi:tRNA dimethylallyltransferase